MVVPVLILCHARRFPLYFLPAFWLALRLVANLFE